MSTYNFNITKNNDTDLKKDILSKMSEIREKYNSDEEYYNFFYDVVFVLNMIDVNSNITLNIKEDSIVDFNKHLWDPIKELTI